MSKDFRGDRDHYTFRVVYTTLAKCNNYDVINYSGPSFSKTRVHGCLKLTTVNTAREHW